MQDDALKKTKYFTLGCPDLFIGTDHKPLLGIFANKDLDSIDNPRIVKLKEKTLGWSFTPVYIPGKKIGGTDALSRHGIREEHVMQEISLHKHLFSLICKNDSQSNVFLKDDDVDLLSALDTTTCPLQVDELKDLTLRDADMKTLITYIQIGFPNTKEEVADSLTPYWPVRN